MQVITNSSAAGLAGAQQVVGLGQQPLTLRQTAPSQPANTIPSSGAMDSTKVLDKRRLQELVKEVDPLEQLDDDVEEVNF